MKITDFSRKLSSQEGMKKSVDIAQISEVLKIANLLLDGQLYSAIKKMAEEESVPSVRVLNPKSKKTVGKKTTNKTKKS